MTFADDIADLWKKVPKEVPDAEKPAHFARILRLTMQSKKVIVESGRPSAVLPMVREIVRRQYLRIPSEHVPYLEVTVFDLLANPVKKKLQESVSRFTSDDVALVRWFVTHAKKDATLALDVKILEDWLSQNAPQAPPDSGVPGESNAAFDSFAPASPDTSSQDPSTPDEPASQAPASDTGEPVTSDRVFES